MPVGDDAADGLMLYFVSVTWAKQGKTANSNIPSSNLFILMRIYELRTNIKIISFLSHLRDIVKNPPKWGMWNLIDEINYVL